MASKYYKKLNLDFGHLLSIIGGSALLGLWISGMLGLVAGLVFGVLFLFFEK